MSTGESTTAFPRVLIITPGVINPYRESGVTLTNLLRGWPPDRLAQIHADPSAPAEAEVGGIRLYDASGGARGSYRPLQRRLRVLQRFVTGRADVALLWSRLSPALRAWLDEVRPDVIVSQTGNLGFLRLTRQVAAYTGAPLVLYAADDWVSDWPANNLGRRVPGVTDAIGVVVRREFAALARSARGHMAIGDAMARAYGERYGATWQVVPNPVDLDRWPARLPEARSYDPRAPFRILYSGSLHTMSQLSAVIEVADAVEGLARDGRPVSLEIATHAGFAYLRDRLHRPPFVTMHDLVPPEDLRDRLSGVDLLLMPVVFEEAHLPYIRLSMQGKVSEYLASGTPVLVYAPAETAVAQHATQHGWGEVVTERGATALRAAIVRLLEDAPRRRTLSQRGREVAAREFSAARQVPAFQQALRDAAAPADGTPSLMAPVPPRTLTPKQRVGRVIGRPLYRAGGVLNALGAWLMDRFMFYGVRDEGAFDPPAGVWIDVGANLGGNLDRAPAGTMLVAFEPDVALAARLRERFPQAVVVPAAVTTRDGAAAFHRNSDHATSSLLPLDQDALRAQRGSTPITTVGVDTVPTMRLDTFLAAAGIAHVDFLSIDAQGADLEVLASLGDRIADVDAVRVEASVGAPQYVGATNTESAVREFLEARGFTLARRSEIVHGQAVDLSFERRAATDPGARG